MTPAERIAGLEAMVAQQREQIAALLEHVHELVARLATDGHNSSKPPSSDGLARRIRSLWRKSGKKPGGQLGHRGETLRLVTTRDMVVEQRPSVYAGFLGTGGSEHTRGAARAAPGAGPAALALTPRC